MASIQNNPVSPPLPDDKTFADFSEVIQRNLADLFDLAHSHDVSSAIPSANEGTPGDIKLVKVNSNFYLYAKFSGSDGWKGIQLTL